MPNWCYNQLVIEGEEKDVITFIDFIGNDENKFDFNRVIPMPEILKKTTKGRMTIDGVSVSSWIEEDGKQRIPNAAERSEMAQIGYEDWYEWACASWGTKWNASDVEIDSSGYGYAEITFTTAWCAPTPVIEALREKFPLLDIAARYRCEDESLYPNEY